MLRFFWDKVQLSSDYTIRKVSHSLADSDGESDITLILQYPNKKVALLIEDKIDAPTMPKQSEHYHLRAQKAIYRGEYDLYYIILVAPADYHDEHTNDSNAAYDYRVCYEELKEYLVNKNHLRDAFKAAMIDCAIKEKKSGYQVQEVPAVTEFWIKLRKFCKEYYPQLSMVGEDTPKGASATWPEFRTSLGMIKVIYKSQKGYVDLEFPKYGDNIADLMYIIKDRMTDPMRVWKTGKSASVRICDDRWKVDFSQNFEQYEEIITEVLQAVTSLCEFASKLNYSELY